MATATRTIGRQVTNTFPAWRTSMTQTDRVYEVGDAPSLNLPGKIVWPSGSMPQFYAGTDSNPVYLHNSYGSSVWVPDTGAFGSLVFTYTGEATFCDQMTEFRASEGTPSWEMWQQPGYVTSEAAAIAAEADCYFGTYPANQLSGGESAWGGWNGQFPVGYNQFVWRRKVRTSMLGNNRWHSARYDMPRYIPASMTGTGRGAIIVTSAGPIHGPFAQGQSPSGVAESSFFDSSVIWTGNTRKYYLYAQDVLTKAWSVLSTPLPQSFGRYYIAEPWSFVDTANKRLYYVHVQGGSYGVTAFNFTSGLAGMTVVPFVAATGSGAAQFIKEDFTNSVFTEGHPSGRRLFYARNHDDRVLMLDLDTMVYHALSISGLPSSGYWAWGYDRATNRLFVTVKNPGGNAVTCYKMTIPADPTNAAAYSVQAQSLTMTGVTLESSAGLVSFQNGARGKFIDSLGVIFLSQRLNKMLAFRPS